MSSTAEEIAARIAEDRSTENDTAEETENDEAFDETVLDSYITEDNHIAPEIVNWLRSNDQIARVEAAKKLYRLIDKRETTSVQPIINSGLIPDIVAMISSDDLELQVPLSSVLTFLTAQSSENIILSVVEAGAIGKCVFLASASASDRARDNGLCGLGNIGVHSQLLGEGIIREGGLKPLLGILGDPSKHKDSHRYWAAKAIAGITYQLSPGVAGYEAAARDLIPVLTTYIEYQQDETAGSLQSSLSALGNISEDGISIDPVLEASIIPRIVQLCASKEASTRYSAIQCIGHILLGDGGTNHSIKARAIEALLPCISSEDPQDRLCACQAASDVVASTLGQVEILMKAGFVPMLVKVTTNSEEEAETRGQAAWALGGLAYAWGAWHQEILESLLEANCLEGLLLALALPDQSAVATSMQGILALVKNSGRGKPNAIQRIEAAGGVALLRAFKLRPEPDLGEERRMAHIVLKEHLKQFSLPPRV
ncbi:hypothetical protein FRC01_001149 [Tulasnella sp. 417]|nr:hypothetical protein FRC01_001149 [Tulasnella sp. 417]